MTAVMRIGEWGRARRLVAGAAGRFERALRRSLQTEAERARDEIRAGLDRQSPGGTSLSTLAPMTLAARALTRQTSRKALIERGEMLRGVTDFVRGERAFVGIRRTARGRDGRPLAVIAQLQERGGTVRLRVTPAMRRFLAAAARVAGTAPRARGGASAARTVRIPARPFLAPSFLAATRGARPRWARAIGRAMGWGV
jgi:hypothetical protein